MLDIQRCSSGTEVHAQNQVVVDIQGAEVFLYDHSFGCSTFSHKQHCSTKLHKTQYALAHC